MPAQNVLLWAQDRLHLVCEHGAIPCINVVSRWICWKNYLLLIVMFINESYTLAWKRQSL